MIKQALWIGILASLAFLVARECSSNYFASRADSALVAPGETDTQGGPSVLGGQTPIPDLTAEEITILEAICETEGLTGMEACRDRLWELGMHGLMRLSDDDLVRRAELLHSAMLKMPPEKCAHAAHGVIEGSEFQELFDLLTEGQQVELATIYLRAAVRHDQDSPRARGVDEGRFGVVLEAIDDHLSATEAVRLWDSIEEPERSTSEDLCWSGLTLYSMTWKLPSPHGHTLARAFSAAP